MRVEPHDGISALIRETPWSSLFPSTRCGHGGKVLAMTRRTQPADDHAGTLILGFQPLELWEMFVYKPGAGVFLLQQPGGTKTGRKNLGDLDLEP